MPLSAAQAAAPSEFGGLANFRLRTPITVSDQAEVIANELTEFGNNHMALVQELMHPAAFGGSSALGNAWRMNPAETVAWFGCLSFPPNLSDTHVAVAGKPLMAKSSGLGAIDNEVLSSFAATQFVPNKMVLAAAG